MKKFNFIDIHYHANPDLYKRRYNAIEAGRQYHQLKGAVVLKSHLGSTAVQATIAQQEGYSVFPSLTLNNINGGINYRAIIQALANYQPVFPSKLIVDLPTITGRQHHSKLSRVITFPLWKKKLCYAEKLLTDQGKLKKQLIDVLKASNDYPIILSTGHAEKKEIYALLEAGYQYNIKALLLNQPANPLTGIKFEELLGLSTHPFVWLEQTALTYLLGYQNEKDFSNTLQKIPRLIYSSDLGQLSQIDISEWLKLSDNWFSLYNLPISRREKICLNHPLQLITL